MQKCFKYLKKRFSQHLGNYELIPEKTISFSDMIKQISNSGQRNEFDTVFNKRTIKPNGDVIFLKKKDDSNYIKIILISEIRRQGINDQRKKDGKPKQAQGNAIERLGKNLTGIRAALNHEKITPFVCFGYGCDFVKDYNEKSFVMSKISMLNEFYKLNTIYVFKHDGSSDKNSYAPVSLFFQQDEWEENEMYEILKEVGKTALRHYIF